MGGRKLAMVGAVAARVPEGNNTLIDASEEAMRVQTPGGVFSVRWDKRGSATALGQLAFFAEYLEATGLIERWHESCPLSYSSPNAPALIDVLGAWMLAILDGQCRYAHVGALRGDGVAPSILGMNKIIGDDSLRRALSAIAPAPDDKYTIGERAAQQAQLARAVRWMQEQLKHSIAQATATPWILDCDTTIKPLYGRQDGAVISYNPHKPGRPSHAIDTYWIGNLGLGSGRPARTGQPAQPGARPSRVGGLAGGHARAVAATAGWRRLRLWQRGRDERTGGHWQALPVQAAPKRGGRKAGAEAMGATRLVRRRPGLAGL